MKPPSTISFALSAQPGETLSDLGRRLLTRLEAQSATPLHVMGFGRCDARAQLLAALRQLGGRTDWPLTWAEGAACGDLPVAGLQVHAFAGAVERLEFDGRVVASVFTDGGARQCIVGGFESAAPELSRPEQTVRVLERLQGILARADFELADLIRTWFFLEDILSWYQEFNVARTGFYSAVNFRTGSLPASTGVGARNPAGAGLTLTAWAWQPLGVNTYAEEVASPLQCPAPAYGSSFSRALETTTGAGRRLFVSGTASIAPGGATQWVGDFNQQVELTMEVVEAILRSRGLRFADLASAVAYFRRPADIGVFAEWLATHQLAHLPIISTQCDVCRDDLLFELEAEALATSPAPE